MDLAWNREWLRGSMFSGTYNALETSLTSGSRTTQMKRILRIARRRISSVIAHLTQPQGFRYLGCGSPSRDATHGGKLRVLSFPATHWLVADSQTSPPHREAGELIYLF